MKISTQNNLRDAVKKNPDYLVTLIIFPLTPTHLPPRMTYDKSDLVVESLPPTHRGEIMTYS